MAVIILVLAFVLSLIIELPQYIDRHQKSKAVKDPQTAKQNVVQEHQ